MSPDPKAQLRAHEIEIGKLSRKLAQIGASGAAPQRADVVLLTAQLLRHRIEVALLASRLDEPLPR